MSTNSTNRTKSADERNSLYDYDYHWFENVIRVAVPTLFSVIVLVGFVGNLVVVLVVSLYRRARTATSLLMLNLAVADLIFIVVCVPTTAARYALPVWPLGSAWCKVYTTIFVRGVDPYGTGGTRPPIFGLGDIITNVPLYISRVISATFYPCNIFLIS